MRRTHLGRKRPGHHLMICELSGWRMWDDEALLMWDGKWVHKDFYEERHPQDFVRGRADDESVDPVRSEGTDNDPCGGSVYELDTYDLYGGDASNPRLYNTCINQET